MLLKTSKVEFDITDTGREYITGNQPAHEGDYILEAMRFEALNCTVYQRRSYREIESGLFYTVEIIAFEEVTSAHSIIRRFIFLNGEFYDATWRSKHRSDNPYNNQCSSSDKLLMYGLEHMDNLVCHMAYNEKLALGIRV